MITLSEASTFVLIVLMLQLCTILTVAIVCVVKFAFGSNKVDGFYPKSTFDPSQLCHAFENLTIDKKDQDVKEEKNLKTLLNDGIDNNSKSLEDLNCVVNSLMKVKSPKNVKQLSELVIKSSKILKDRNDQVKKEIDNLKQD